MDFPYARPLDRSEVLVQQSCTAVKSGVAGLGQAGVTRSRWWSSPRQTAAALQAIAPSSRGMRQARHRPGDLAHGGTATPNTPGPVVSSVKPFPQKSRARFDLPIAVWLSFPPQPPLTSFAGGLFEPMKGAEERAWPWCEITVARQRLGARRLGALVAKGVMGACQGRNLLVYGGGHATSARRCHNCLAGDLGHHCRVRRCDLRPLGRAAAPFWPGRCQISRGAIHLTGC